MRAGLKRRIPQITLLVLIAVVAATVESVVWAAKGSSSHRAVRADATAKSAVLVAGGQRRVARPARSARAKAPSAAPSRVASSAKATTAASATSAVGAGVDPDLCAVAGNATLTGGVSVPIWGFALKGAAADCSDVAPQLPGPQIDVNEGDAVTISVHNALDRPIEIEAPGITFDPGPTTAAPGATVTLTFTATTAAGTPPGTYLYESGADAGRQEAMGLYGALVVHSSTPGSEYGNAFAFEYPKVLVLSEIDSALNTTVSDGDPATDPSNFDMNTWKPMYWLINGKAYPDTVNITGVAAGQSMLLRYANAGIDNHTMTMLGLRQTVIGRDDFGLANPFNIVSEIFPSGQTQDAIVQIPPGTSGKLFPLYNRNLNLQNGAFGSAGHSPGGMMAFISVS